MTASPTGRRPAPPQHRARRHQGRRRPGWQHHPRPASPRRSRRRHCPVRLPHRPSRHSSRHRAGPRQRRPRSPRSPPIRRWRRHRTRHRPSPAWRHRRPRLPRPRRRPGRLCRFLGRPRRLSRPRPRQPRSPRRLPRLRRPRLPLRRPDSSRICPARPCARRNGGRLRHRLPSRRYQSPAARASRPAGPFRGRIGIATAWSAGPCRSHRPPHPVPSPCRRRSCRPHPPSLPGPPSRPRSRSSPPGPCPSRRLRPGHPVGLHGRRNTTTLVARARSRQRPAGRIATRPRTVRTVPATRPAMAAARGGTGVAGTTARAVRSAAGSDR